MMPHNGNDPPETVNDIPVTILNSLADELLKLIKAFYDTPEGQQEFEAWKRLQDEKE